MFYNNFNYKLTKCFTIILIINLKSIITSAEYLQIGINIFSCFIHLIFHILDRNAVQEYCNLEKKLDTEIKGEEIWICKLWLKQASFRKALRFEEDNVGYFRQ